MAIAYDNSAYVTYSNGYDAIIDYTCSGTDRILIVVAHSFSRDVGDVRYGGTTGPDGTPLTKITSQNSGGSYFTSLWYLINPSSGTHKLYIHGLDSGTGGMAASYTGVKQTGQPDSFSKAASTSNSFTQSTTTVADNCRTILGKMSNSSCTTTAGTGTTERIDTLMNGMGISLFDSNGPLTPAGSKSLEFTQDTSRLTCRVMCSISPSISVGPANIKSINGLVSASIKSVNGLTISSIKSINGLA